MDLRIFPPDGILEASVDLPKSKSMSARALIINKIQGCDEPGLALSDSDDTQALINGLGQTSGKVNIGPAGTAMRFLTAYYAATPGVDIILDGDERMRRRPIAILVDALRSLGAQIEYEGNEGFAPLKIQGRQLSGGTVTLDSTVSSQFISALMMIAPKLSTPLTLLFNAEPTSLPYIKMTAGMMTASGVGPDIEFCKITVPNHPYTSPVTEVERDWSAASYWYAIAALSAGWVTLNDMSANSLQGDSAIKTYGERLGVVTSASEDTDDALELSASPEQFSRLDADMSDTPDLVPTLAIAAAALGIPFRFTGVHTLRTKESDRLEALTDEALKLGLVFETEGDNVLSWEGKRIPISELQPIETYGDHRIAMSFAPLSLFLPGIIIRDTEVVSKSYPDFWTQLEEAGFSLVDAQTPLDQPENDPE